jgi:type IV pilus assembly protein PilA
MTRLRQRLAREEGFTLIELLVVIVIIGILLAIAVPSYLGFRDRANKSAAQSNVKSAMPAAEAYYADHGDYQFNLKQDGTAAATSLAALQDIDSGIDSSLTITAGAASYKLMAVKGGWCVSVTGPGGTLTTPVKAATC